MPKNAKPAPSETEFAALVAIDWADTHHVWCLLANGSPQYERGSMENTPEEVDAWAAQLRQRFSGRPVAVCLEQTRGALVYMLSKYAHLILFPVHPNTAAQYRTTFAPSGAKDDHRDAASLLNLLLHHRDQLRPLQPDTVETRLIQFLAEERRHVVDERTAQSNRLTAHLKLYFPQILKWFHDVNSPLAGALLKRWPSLQQLKRANPAILGKFFHQHNCRNEKLIEERIKSIYAATAATEDQAVLRAGVVIVQGLVARMETLHTNIAELDRQLAELLAEHPDGPVFSSLPGCGKVLAPRMIAAFGTQRDRFEDASQMQCHSGIAPLTIASGKVHQVVFRWASSKFLRQTFQEFAEHSIPYSRWAKAYYNYQRQQQQKDHQAAVRSLAYKWIRILYRCWKDHKPYDEETYLRSLRHRRSPLADLLRPATRCEWKSVAGFQKLSADFA